MGDEQFPRARVDDRKLATDPKAIQTPLDLRALRTVMAIHAESNDIDAPSGEFRQLGLDLSKIGLANRAVQTALGHDPFQHRRPRPTDTTYAPVDHPAF